jgi:hypothetical protein
LNRKWLKQLRPSDSPDMKSSFIDIDGYLKQNLLIGNRCLEDSGFQFERGKNEMYQGMEMG